jgi:Mce-associated membrane protein
VEDQPADSGDLTTDAELPPDAESPADDKVARHRHRMPLRKKLAAGGEDTDKATDVETSVADVQPEPAAAEVPDVAEAEPAASRRRWSLFRRRSKTPEPEAVSAPTEDVAEPEEPEAAQPVVRVPVGKASRTAKTVTESEPTADETPVVENPEAESTETESAETASTETGDAPAEGTPQEEPILVPHRPAGKRLTIAAAAAGVAFVGAAAFAGATLQPYLADRALVHTKLDVARTAANAITTLWTYTPDNLDKLPDRSAGYLGGDFANEYRKYIDAIVAPNKQAQVTNTTQVMGTAVESVTPTEATAIVYTNSVATSPVSKNIPSLRYLSYRLTMQRHDAKWLITRMSTVTSFDLTPQL